MSSGRILRGEGAELKFARPDRWNHELIELAQVDDVSTIQLLENSELFGGKPHFEVASCPCELLGAVVDRRGRPLSILRRCLRHRLRNLDAHHRKDSE